MAASFGVLEVNRGDIVYTAKALEAISSGWFVNPAYTALDDKVTSLGVASLTEDDIGVWACNDASGSFCTGLALQDMASGSFGAIATRGLYIVRTNANIEAGAPVKACIAANGEDSVKGVTVGTDDVLAVGKLLTGTSASGSYAVLLLNI